ncbi:YceI family protein [Dinoroseobacter sp. PD6]|uniref:YceI family protein n=1 Tax=Dinoroseobacter sp. PD6 TaxID=3028384 RepID=UPI00237BF06D|nr:YceI family protein [Dinoroseobacter sp. PD6]MDD9716998.1 YceI family protein [Dinoroseobacter sp. PD6]
MHRRGFFLGALLWPLAGWAAPRPYRLGPGSTVAFTYRLSGIASGGQIPIRDADLQLDFATVGNSRVTVTMDATGARTTLPLADTAMKGPSVLDTARFPTITYASTAMRRTETGAEVLGDLRVRDVTAPVALTARFFRKPDRAPQDLAELVIELTGGLSRAAFGATGFADLVDDRIDLRILAEITRQG